MTSFYLEFINIFAGKMAYDVFYRNNDLIKFRVKIVNTQWHNWRGRWFFHSVTLFEYLYTGTLSISANNKQLLSLAEINQVETLKKICQLVVVVSDAEDITSFLFSFIWVLNQCVCRHFLYFLSS